MVTAKPDSWEVKDMWDDPNTFQTRRRKRQVVYNKPTYNQPSGVTRMKKKKRSPVGLLKVYERFGKINKEKFANASPSGKRHLLQEYQINPRNTESGSYAVSGIEPRMHSYYNMLADKHKNRILKLPTEKRMDLLNYIYELDHQRKTNKPNNV
jgi:hypothetical protein